MSENDEKFQLFSKTVFSSKWFYRYEECSFDRPAKIVLLNYRKWLKKSPQKVQKFFKISFFKMFLWRGRKQLESPADFFFDSQPKSFQSIFKKITICKFCKKTHPKVSIETENSVLTTPLLFFARIGQKKSLSVQKGKKNRNKTVLR